MMSSVYIITEDQVIGEHHGERPAFAFTSLKKAEKQMDTISKMATEGSWFVDTDDYEVIRDTRDYASFGILRQITVVCKGKTGWREDYALYKLELNSGYGIGR